MALEKYDGESMDLGFPKPASGTYVWQFQDGIDTYTNDDTGKVSIKLPMKVFIVIKGDEDALDNQHTLFIGVDNKTAENQMNAILTFTGLIDKFIEKLGNDVDIADPKFLAGLKKFLPGKMIGGEHELKSSVSKKDGKTYENVNFKRLFEYKPDTAKKSAQKSAPAAGSEDAGGDAGGWD